jgi:integrase
VFPANSKSKHIEEPKFPLKAVADATGIQVSVHDLRRTYITVAESTDMSVLALKALVNHSLGKDVTEGYIQMTAERLREPAQRVADKLKTLTGIEPPRGVNVTKLKG